MKCSRVHSVDEQRSVFMLEGRMISASGPAVIQWSGGYARGLCGVDFSYLPKPLESGKM